MNEILYESDIVSLIYFKPEQLVELVWKKSPNSAEFRSTYSAAIDFAKKCKTPFFLSDIRNEGPVLMEDLKWLEKEVIVRAVDFGVKKVALVSDNTLYSNLYAETIKKKFDNSPIKVNIFEDFASAKAWLLAIN
jgi:hypothetical protein